jgi:hypothetical protein
VNLDELRITDIRPRRAATGALILEIPGREGGREKASPLAERMASVLGDTLVKVAVLRKIAELSVTGLKDSVTLEEVVAAVVEAGGCSAGEVSAGVLRFARKIITEGGRPNDPLKYYRCLETGHVRRGCKSEIDRSDRCYRCGGQGHRSRDCLARASRYTICEDAWLPAAHRMGSQACKSPTTARRRRGTQPEETGVRSRTRDGSVGRADREWPARKRPWTRSH